MPGPAWIVLPTYCEAESLERVVAGLRAAMPAGTCVLVVDDASPDGTGAIADRLAAAGDGVSVLNRAARHGLGPAYVAGFTHARAHGAGYVVEMDSDGSHDPDAVPALLEAPRSGADLVLGSRYVAGGRVENWSGSRRVVSRAGCLYARAMLRLPVRDLTSGMKCFRAETLATIDYASARARGYAFQVELTYRTLRAGLRVVELPIVFCERPEGESKMTWRIALEAAWRIPALRLQSRGTGADLTRR
jgi:dolichol-phosphate mannosyltransferase